MLINLRQELYASMNILKDSTDLKLERASDPFRPRRSHVSSCARIRSCSDARRWILLFFSRSRWIRSLCSASYARPCVPCPLLFLPPRRTRRKGTRRLAPSPSRRSPGLLRRSLLPLSVRSFSQGSLTRDQRPGKTKHKR